MFPRLKCASKKSDSSPMARSYVRLETKMEAQPWAIRWRAASSLIFPAPTMKTFLPCSVPKIFLASSTATDATDTDDEPTAVSLRTRLATAKARLKS